jgi:hypothetical protein
LKREELVAQIDEGRCAALAAKFELEQSTVESQSLFNVADLERYVVETDCASFSCFSHGVTARMGTGALFQRASATSQNHSSSQVTPDGLRGLSQAFLDL